MRAYLFLLVFILLNLCVNASWQTFQGDLRNTGSSNGTGYFPLKTVNFSDDSLGMDFQPLIGNLDGSGNKEIVIFSNNSLVVFNPQLGILAQAKIGQILGQPALFDYDGDNLIEIVFNSRQNSTDYFFSYQYNSSNLQQEFNLTLSNEANFSGIKCVEIDNNGYCIFKDKGNFIHVIDMDSKIDNAYNTSEYNESRQTVPAIGDIDNDGKLDAVFWFNKDNSGGYGFLAFDLDARKVKWIADDIFSPFLNFYFLKGQPVLVDLNSDKNLEIAASAFYDDSSNTDFTTDWFTQLIVHSFNGSFLFKKCEQNVFQNIGCNDGSSQQSRWEGSNALAMDFDKNGMDEVCFIKDVKTTVSTSKFSHMALSCYNHSGDETARIKLINNNAINGIASTADMNNDGINEIILYSDIYLLNETSIFRLPMDKSSLIAADIDGNKGLDMVWTSGNQTKVFLDSNNYTIDLSVDDFNINFLKFNQTHVNVSAIIKNVGEIEAGNIKAAVYNAETLENQTYLLDIKKNKNSTLSALLGLKEGEKVLVSVDFDNEINETSEKNNFAFKEFVRLPYVFVSSDVEPFNLNSEFQDYIKNKLTSGYYTPNEAVADVNVYIGKNNARNKDSNIRTLNEFEFGYDYGNIFYNDKTGSLPYNALVASFKDGAGKINVMIAGNDIEGDIAGVKGFIESQPSLLNIQGTHSIFIEDENIEALKVYDYLHLSGNNEHYKVRNDEFKKIVKNSLYDTMFTAVDRTVMTSNGITLRLRNLRANFSNDYLEYLNSTGVPVDMPVVLAHGLFSNLTTWETLGAEISNTGRDTWLIEITGGTGQDCNDCIDYTFYNLTDIFVPALLNGVLNFTGKDKLQYVGFSNGCRSTLDSMERNQFDSNKIETFVAVGCPGSFEGNSTLGDIIASKNGQIFERLNSRNLNHVSMKDIIVIGALNRNTISNNKDKISLNLWKFYEDIIRFNNDTQPGKINVSDFVIIQGSAFGSDDGIVTMIDEGKIYQNANLNTKPKKRFDIFAVHTTLDVKDRTKSIIKKLINKQELSFYERNVNLINQSG